MYAIIEVGGRQYQVAVGQKIQVNQLAVAKDDEVSLKNVLLVSSDQGVSLDPGVLSDTTVRAIVTRNLRGPKIRVFKHKRRTGFQKTKGHRQELTELLITDILGGEVSLAKDEAEAPKAEAAPEAAPAQEPGAQEPGAQEPEAPKAEAAAEPAEAQEPEAPKAEAAAEPAEAQEPEAQKPESEAESVEKNEEGEDN